MSLWPFQNRTLVLSCTADEGLRRLRSAAFEMDKKEFNPKEKLAPEDEIEFNGWFSDYNFRVSKRITHPDNFLPLVDGRLEPTSNGSILFVNFKLFFGSLVMVMLWTILSILLSIFFIFVYKHTVYASIAVVVGLVQYIVVMLNFNRQVVRTWITLKDVLVERK
jgi:hypothetical protein